jgi:serine/threonine protein kinase
VDFGLAKDLQPEQTETAFCGSLGYIAPEIYLREAYRFEVDLFSFGVLMFKILSGRRPWPAGPAEETGRKTVNLEYRIIKEQWKNVSSLGQDFIKRLLVYREERLGVDGALGHDWLSETTTSVLRVGTGRRPSITNNPSGAVIGGASHSQGSRECSRFWVDDLVQEALQLFIPSGAFRGRIVSSERGHACVEEILPLEAKLLPYYIIDVENYTERECRNVCREIARRIRLFHNNQVVHRKLHMENVVVEGQVGHFAWGAMAVMA